MSPSLGSLLQPEEQQWLEVLSRLVERFESFPAEQVVDVLRKVGGHAGQAAAMLRDLSGTEMRPVDPDDAEHVRVLLSSPQMFSHACTEEFRKFDANGDGALEWKEVSSLVMTLYESFGLEPPRLGGLRKFFEANDTNKDGVLSEKEFRRFFEDFLRYAFFDIVSHQKAEEKPREAPEAGDAPEEPQGRRAQDSVAEPQAQPEPKRTTSEGDRERRKAGERRSRDRLGTGGEGEGRHGNHGAASSITFLRCAAPDGVPLRRTADYEDRTESVVQAGETIQVLERWVRTSKGWLPLTNESGKPLFELASAESEKAKSRASRKSARVVDTPMEQVKTDGKKESGGGDKVGGERFVGEKVEGEKAVDLTNDSEEPISTRQPKDSARQAKSSSHHSSKRAAKAGAALPDDWKERFETLQKRFPDIGADIVLQALRNHTGHAGHAAKELRDLSAGG